MTDLDVKRLRRVVALLLALANIAEGVARRSQAVRWSVLWLLLPGEAIARDYAAGLTFSPLPPQDAANDTRPGDTPEDALRLARSFRAIAATLMSVLEWLALSLVETPAHAGISDLPWPGALATLSRPQRCAEIVRLDSS